MFYPKCQSRSLLENTRERAFAVTRKVCNIISQHWTEHCLFHIAAQTLWLSSLNKTKSEICCFTYIGNLDSRKYSFLLLLGQRHCWWLPGGAKRRWHVLRSTRSTPLEPLKLCSCQLGGLAQRTPTHRSRCEPDCVDVRKIRAVNLLEGVSGTTFYLLVKWFARLFCCSNAKWKSFMARWVIPYRCCLTPLQEVLKYSRRWNLLQEFTVKRKYFLKTTRQQKMRAMLLTVSKCIYVIRRGFGFDMFRWFESLVANTAT